MTQPERGVFTFEIHEMRGQRFVSEDQQWQAPEGTGPENSAAADSASAANPAPTSPATRSEQLNQDPPRYGARAEGSGYPTPGEQPYGSPTGSAPTYGAQVPPAYGAPPYGAPAYGAPGGQPYGAPQATGWTPPPKPGLIPLRPLSLGDVLGASFQVLRRNPKPTFGVSLLWQAIVIVLTVVLMGGVTALVVWRTSMASGADADAVAAGGVAAILVSAVVPLLLSVVAAGLMQGIIALEVARGAVGEKLRFRGLWQSARGRLGALVGWTLLVTLAVLIAIGIVVAAVVGLGFAVGGAVGIAIAVVLSIFAVLGALAIGAWLGTKLALVPSALMIERLPLREAVARSWTLVSGHFWRSFGILLLVAVILNVASQIVTTPMSLLLGMVTPLFSLDDNETSAVVTGLVVYLLLIAVSLVVAAVALVVQAATASLIYIDLRMRKEGLDLELQRFVEARHQPGADARDPLLPGSTARGAEPGWSAQA